MRQLTDFRIAGWARERIEYLRRAHPTWTATDVVHALERDEYREDRPVPAERTIRDYLKALAAADDEPWVIDPDGDSAADIAVLDTLKEALGRTPNLFVSRRDARWIGYLAKLAPDLPPYLRLVAVWHINAQRAAGKDLRELTSFLQWEPWRSVSNFDSYRGAIDAGAVEGAPGLLYVHAERVAKLRGLAK